jgi:hypothetical protein
MFEIAGGILIAFGAIGLMIAIDQTLEHAAQRRLREKNNRAQTAAYKQETKRLFNVTDEELEAEIRRCWGTGRGDEDEVGQRHRERINNIRWALKRGDFDHAAKTYPYEYKLFQEMQNYEAERKAKEAERKAEIEALRPLDRLLRRMAGPKFVEKLK